MAPSHPIWKSPERSTYTSRDHVDDADDPRGFSMPCCCLDCCLLLLLDFQFAPSPRRTMTLAIAVAHQMLLSTLVLWGIGLCIRPLSGNLPMHHPGLLLCYFYLNFQQG